MWFAPPRGSWPKETIGNSAKTSQNFRNLCILEKFWRFFENLVSFLAFHFTDCHSSPKGNDFHEKIHQICWFSGCDFHCKMKKTSEIYAFWTKNWRFFRNSAPFLCSKATIDHAASGWCAAVIFWKKATKFAGFLVVIFTSQSKNLQQFLHSEKNLGNLGRFCEFFCLFILPTGIPLQRKWFSWKNPSDLLVFWLWFAPQNQKICRNLCILNKKLKVF